MSRRLRPRRARGGMTLVEVVVALMIILTMSLIIWETVRNSAEFGRLVSLRDESTKAARVVFSTVGRELQLAYLTPSRTGPVLDRYRTVFVGTDGDPDQIHFATLAHQRIYMNSRESDQAEITIWAESAPSDRGRGYVLYHREAPRVDHEPDDGGKIYPLAWNVRLFNVRYLDPQTGEWRDEWDTRGADTPYRLPRAVELGLVMIGPDPEYPNRTVDIPFMSSVVLEYAARMTPKYPSLGPIGGGMVAPPLGGGGWPQVGGMGPGGGQQGTGGRQGGTRQPTQPGQIPNLPPGVRQTRPVGGAAGGAAGGAR